MEKFKRKHFFINKRLQMRYMISMLIPMLILVVFIGAVMFKSQSLFLKATLREINKDINRNIIAVNNMVYADASMRNAKTVADIKNRLITYQSDNAPFSSVLLASTYKILFIGLAIVLAELCFLTIFISHKVVGPIYRLTKFAEEVRNGNFNARIYLRQGDELLDVATDFNKASDFLKETFTRALTINDALLAVARNANADPATLSMLQRESDELKAKIKLS
ncbi:MAG: methyl-accepting chemotaxis protein [Fibrobacterota bacterium]